MYANFAKAEEYPLIMHHFTKCLFDKIHILDFDTPIVFVGPAMGGISIAQFLAYHASKKVDARYACAEKVIIQLKTDTVREQATFQFARHAVNGGETVIISEDVLNNFSTTKQLIELVEKRNAKVEAIVGLLNRSMTIGLSYVYNDELIPVIPLVHKPYDEYKQDDPYVIEDVLTGNIVLKPKNEWSKLKIST